MAGKAKKLRLSCCEACEQDYEPKRHWQKYCTKTCFQRNYDYLRNYGISLKQYQELYDSQEGRCKICKKHSSESARELAVDHNHETLEIRGLLCDNCNRGLGFFQESPNLLEEALRYLNGR